MCIAKDGSISLDIMRNVAPAPERDSKMDAALKYLELVKGTFYDQPQVYERFLQMVKCYKDEEMSAKTIMRQVQVLFGDHKQLVTGLNMFLPAWDRTELSPTKVVQDVKKEKEDDILHKPLDYTPPHSNNSEKKQATSMECHHKLLYERSSESKPSRGQKSSCPPNQIFDHDTPRSTDGKEWMTQYLDGDDDKEDTTNQDMLCDIEGGGIDFEDDGEIRNPEMDAFYESALSFVAHTKERLDPTSFQTFLDFLYAFQTKSQPIEAMLQKVSKLFSKHPDLLNELAERFLPRIAGSFSTTPSLRNDDVAAVDKTDDDTILKVEHHRQPSDTKSSSSPPEVVELKKRRLPTTHTRRKKSLHIVEQEEEEQSPQAASTRRPLFENENERKKWKQQHEEVFPVQLKTLKRKLSSIQGKSNEIDGSRSSRNNKARHSKSKDGEKESGEYSSPAAACKEHMLLAEQHTRSSSSPFRLRKSQRLLQDKKCVADCTCDDSSVRTATTIDVAGSPPVGSSSSRKHELTLNKLDPYLFKVEGIFNKWCRQSLEDFWTCIDLYFSGKLSEDVLLEIVYDVCDGNKEFYEDFLSFLERNARDGTTSNSRGTANSFISHSARGKLEQSVLNDTWVSMPVGSEGTEQYKQMERNPTEVRLLEFEEERYEMDMLVNVALSTISRLQPIATEIEAIKRIEKNIDANNAKVSGPLIFTNFKMGNNALNAAQYTLIRRLYREFGDDVLAYLKNNARESVPIILKRLNKKVKEWRDARAKQMAKWDDLLATDYTKSFDHQSESYKLNSKKLYTSRELFKGLRRLDGSHCVRKSLRIQVAKNERLRSIFARDVRALLIVAAESGPKFTSHSLKTQTEALKYIDLASDGFVPLLLGIEDPSKFVERFQMMHEDDDDDIFNLLDDDDDDNDVLMNGGEENSNIEKEVIESPDAPHPPGFDEGGGKPPEHLSQGGGGGGSEGNDDKAVCTYVGTAEEYLVMRLYCMFMSKLELAWKLCQGTTKHEHLGLLMSNSHKAIESHADAVQFSTKTLEEFSCADDSVATAESSNSIEMGFIHYRTFLGLVGAWLGRIISQEKYEQSIRQLVGNDAYKFLCLDKLTSRLLFRLCCAASKSGVVMNKFGSLARYERMKLLKSGIPLTWNRTISRARKIVKTLPLHVKVNDLLYVMMMRQNGAFDIRHVNLPRAKAAAAADEEEDDNEDITLEVIADSLSSPK